MIQSKGVCCAMFINQHHEHARISHFGGIVSPAGYDLVVDDKQVQNPVKNSLFSANLIFEALVNGKSIGSLVHDLARRVYSWPMSNVRTRFGNQREKIVRIPG